MYRDDDIARGARADALIAEIADLERQKVTRATLEQRLESARRELAALQVAPTPPAGPTVLMHVVAFASAAVATYVGYTLLF